MISVPNADHDPEGLAQFITDVNHGLFYSKEVAIQGNVQKIQEAFIIAGWTPPKTAKVVSEKFATHQHMIEVQKDKIDILHFSGCDGTLDGCHFVNHLRSDQVPKLDVGDYHVEYDLKTQVYTFTPSGKKRDTRKVVKSHEKEPSK